MRSLHPVQALTIAAAITILVGCSAGGTSAITPVPASHNGATLLHSVSFDSCPATGPIEYVSDARNSIVYIYKGPFAGQAPCGQITAQLRDPYELYVQAATHDLYVANYAGSGIEVFHRGHLRPYNHYGDPTGQHTADVAVASDGTVIAINVFSTGQEDGSISTWIGGPGVGTFVGNFPLLTNNATGLSVTVDPSGSTVYFDDFQGELWTVQCPAGACGTQTQVVGVAPKAFGGMAFDPSGDLLINNASSPGAGQIFELPNPNPTTFPLGNNGFGMAISQRDHHWFVAYSNNPSTNHDAAEYSYPSGTLVGTVPCCTNGVAIGIAFDQ